MDVKRLRKKKATLATPKKSSQSDRPNVRETEKFTVHLPYGTMEVSFPVRAAVDEELRGLVIFVALKKAIDKREERATSLEDGAGSLLRRYPVDVDTERALSEAMLRLLHERLPAALNAAVCQFVGSLGLQALQSRELSRSVGVRIHNKMKALEVTGPPKPQFQTLEELIKGWVEVHRGGDSKSSEVPPSPEEWAVLAHRRDALLTQWKRIRQIEKAARVDDGVAEAVEEIGNVFSREEAEAAFLLLAATRKLRATDVRGATFLATAHAAILMNMASPSDIGRLRTLTKNLREQRTIDPRK